MTLLFLFLWDEQDILSQVQYKLGMRRKIIHGSSGITGRVPVKFVRKGDLLKLV